MTSTLAGVLTHLTSNASAMYSLVVVPVAGEETSAARPQKAALAAAASLEKEESMVAREGAKPGTVSSSARGVRADNRLR